MTNRVPSRKRILSSCLSVALFVLYAGNAMAYGDEGHRTVGAIADELIKGTNAEKQVKAILGDTLSHVAIWADCARNVKADGIYYPNTSFPNCNDFNGDKKKFEDFVGRNWGQCLPNPKDVGTQLCHLRFHFTDVSNLRSGYDVHDAGATPVDVVHAINAAIVVLRGQPSPEPFHFVGQAEALTLLTHYVGDEHQPLHVAAVYLGDSGQVVDPDGLPHFDTYATTGGNHILYGDNGNLHSEWDAIPANLKRTDPHFAAMVDAARLVPRTSGDILSWSTQWATDTLTVGKAAFNGLNFQFKETNPKGKFWTVTGNQASDYQTSEATLKEQELEKAGARLAQILQAIWPDDAPPATATSGDLKPYLQTAELPAVKAWLPDSPASASGAQSLDEAIFRGTRYLLNTARGRSAAEDDVWNPAQVIQRFAPALGKQTIPTEAVPALTQLIARAQLDAGALVGPAKQRVASGGRLRPFVANPGTPTCLTPVDLAGHRDDDLVTYSLAESGSYPSTHALLGWFVGTLLAELTPEHAAATLARGIEFGDSRVVCGFHYQSDVDAGRLAAAALMARLHANDQFKSDLAEAKKQLGTALAAK